MIPLNEVLVWAAALFGIGLVGVLVRRDLLVVLMSIELLLNAVNLTIIAFARARGDVAGHGLVFLIVALAAAEAAVGLAIVVSIFRTRKTVNVDEITLMKH
ncbi:MAG: NADH-quinone oxidoreductase subunit NuoK [Deltaproteobacteria bacterium]|nr:NADH-quinone oxidoreductase subunit NuoK [Deltaproteobacteria bacterium]